MPQVPAGRPASVASRLWQASSTTGRPYFSAISVIRVMFAMSPAKWTGMIALVRGVIAASIWWGSIPNVSSQSTKTIRAPVSEMAPAVA